MYNSDSDGSDTNFNNKRTKDSSKNGDNNIETKRSKKNSKVCVNIQIFLNFSILSIITWLSSFVGK